MHRISKILGIAALAWAIVSATSACDNGALGSGESFGGPDGRIHYEGPLAFNGQQVWEQNKNTTRISNAYFAFKEDRDINVVVYSPVDYSAIQVGSGKISQGILNVSVNELAPETLLSWDDLKKIFFYWDDVQIDNPLAMGNFIMFISSNNERLNRERLLGTDVSLGQEIVFFIYVDSDCRITGSYGDGTGDGYYYTTSNLDLYLEKGWNTVCRKEVYGQSGKAAISMEVKNPESKWVIYK